MALQDVLGGLKNPAASRSAILQRLGIDPNRAAGFGGNTQFDQQMADLYRQGLQTAAQYDTQEGDLNRRYDQNVAKTAVDRQRAIELIKGNMAGRGLTYSGMNVDEQGRTNTEFDTYLANLGADKSAGLAGIGRGRENLEYGIRAGQQAAESGYGADLGAFLQQQAVELWNSVVAQNQQNAMIAAMNQPAPAPAPVAAPRPVAPRPAPAPAPITPLRTGTLRGQGYGSSSRSAF